MEYGFSCMGYEIAGGIGVKMARPDKEVVVMVGDGSYLMMNSEIATSVILGQKLIIVVLDNHGFGCINRLQMATGGANFNNLWQDCAMVAQPDIDFAQACREPGGDRRQGRRRSASSRPRSRRPRRTTALRSSSSRPHPLVVTEAGGHWWDVRCRRCRRAPRWRRPAKNTRSTAVSSGCSTDVRAEAWTIRTTRISAGRTRRKGNVATAREAEGGPTASSPR